MIKYKFKRGWRMEEYFESYAYRLVTSYEEMDDLVNYLTSLGMDCKNTPLPIKDILAGRIILEVRP